MNNSDFLGESSKMRGLNCGDEISSKFGVIMLSVGIEFSSYADCSMYTEVVAFLNNRSGLSWLVENGVISEFTIFFSGRLSPKTLLLNSVICRRRGEKPGESFFEGHDPLRGRIEAELCFGTTFYLLVLLSKTVTLADNECCCISLCLSS